LAKIIELTKRGDSLNVAIGKVVPSSKRSWVMRNLPSFKRDGWMALIDGRVPREPKIAKRCGPLIETAAAANPSITYEQVISVLKSMRVKVLPSRSTVKKHLTRVRARKHYADKKKSDVKIIELDFAGGELLAAADIETNATSALTDVIVAVGDEAQEASQGLVHNPDVEHRDDKGHFTATYNRKRRRKRGEETASYLLPAAQKAEGRVPASDRFTQEERRTIEPKVKMLTLSPLVSGTQGWDSLRAPDVAGLTPLTGFAYMPSTLYKMTSALAVHNVGERLLEAVGQCWHKVASERFDEAGAMAALYVDNNVKAVWTSLFTQAGKVSRLNRVMPCVTMTYVHTGAGAPVLALLQSGAAPLAPRIGKLVTEAEDILDEEVKRAVIIDSECSTFDVLSSFAEEGRVIVTPMRSSQSKSLELRYGPGSYFRPYREHDELRVAHATLFHKSSGRSVEIGALIVRRQHRDNETVLLTTGLALGVDGKTLADLYFARWPVQENAFKDGVALRLHEHRGNCSRIVSNVAVMTKLEQLEGQAVSGEARLKELREEEKLLQSRFDTAQCENVQAQKQLAQEQGQFDALIEKGHSSGEALGRAAIEHRQAMVRAEKAQQEYARAEQALERVRVKAHALDEKLERVAQKRLHLEPMQKIRELDTSLDAVLTSFKLALSLLITFATREYLSSMPMASQTFMTRVFRVRGRREIGLDEERVVFYENQRDPEISATLADACKKLNARKLYRGERRLLYSIESQPKAQSG
jgi:hypothetical protein